ncbi:hypothetical protein Nepgr_001827 [Nepenthes gracilis]|uniref:Protein kinase domain-containing protein n=1 Tax=Nepenthes gracilis TaxID=150966 RepID=A0AAD3RXW4_NEPGR|nr:hypothetical protein Nepgr_001827 [Nepenthes gracilis]
MTSIDRVGEGIYPQISLLAHDNVGQFIKPILKDHLRHSVVIADDVGANIGCCYQTYAIPSGAALIVTTILHDPYHTLGLVYYALGNKTTVENKFTNDASRDQPVVVVVSSTTTSNTESSTSTSKVEELKVSSLLRKFAFNDLKFATRSFRPESLLGEGGFGCVFKGWIEENGTAPRRLHTGLIIAIKTLNHDGLRGRRDALTENPNNGTETNQRSGIQETESDI